MSTMMTRSGLRISEPLLRLVEDRILPDTGVSPESFWQGVSDLFTRFTPENRFLLSKRETLQKRIDDWHRAHRREPHDGGQYREFLREIGYLAPEPAPFSIGAKGVDDEVARVAGPQLVVPVLNARYVLNAANARWGSLYDALYGTDALEREPGEAASGYDRRRGARVVARAKSFLDQTLPLLSGRHLDVTAWRVREGLPALTLADGAETSLDGTRGAQFVGYRGERDEPAAMLFRHHGLHIELTFDRSHGVGRDDPAGLADIILESALTTIVDFEDSVAAVDGDDKAAAYANWLALIRGDLQATFEKGGTTLTRTLAPDRKWISPEGSAFTVPGRSLLLVRNVGLHMTTPAVRLADGSAAFEGILDAVITGLIGLHDLRALGRYRNSRAGSIYIVKPKLHGPEEASFTNRLFDAVEDLLGLDRHTLKVGVMDEERRTSANLSACIHAVRDRIIFINTGFLDRTGDEIHTSMQAGAMARKAAMKETAWIRAYEARNVRIGLAHGFSGRAQIGKGMWAAPDRMAEMLDQKIAHPLAGASTAWVPSPTAATLHALHYHAVDVGDRQKTLSHEPSPGLEALLSIPLAPPAGWSAQEVACELDNNAQGILGYVVRWVDQGVGCSKVPDINDVGLMEDRATLRISSQHIANWLLHGVCSPQEVDAALRRMAAKVDAQNTSDPCYRRMSGNEDWSLAFQAARALIFEGVGQHSGYTEALLHAFREQAKQRG